MEIIIAQNEKELAKKAFEVVKEVLETNENPILGLATGSSPVGLYQEMIKDHLENNTSYQNVTTWNLDEYVGISKDHEQSYHTFMDEQLFNHIDIPKENTHVPFGNSDADAAAYEEAIPSVDLQVLGIGENGHIGFNEPGTAFDSPTHITDLTESTRAANKRFFPDEEVPTQAITQGIGTIMNAKKILLVANGPKKAEAIQKMIEGELNEEVPASVLQNHPDVVVVLDPEAASLLKKTTL